MRQKTYSALTGYVYQYAYQGCVEAPDGSTWRYVFQVSADRRTTFPVVISIPRAVLAGWEREHATRALEPNERYAVAKLSLMQAFDEMPPGELEAEFELTADQLREVSGVLGWE